MLGERIGGIDHIRLRFLSSHQWNYLMLTQTDYMVEVKKTHCIMTCRSENLSILHSSFGVSLACVAFELAGLPGV